MKKIFIAMAISLSFSVGGAMGAECYPSSAETAARELLEGVEMRVAVERQEYLTYVREETCWLMTEYGDLLETDYAGMLRFTDKEYRHIIDFAEEHGVHYLHLLAAAEHQLGG